MGAKRNSLLALATLGIFVGTGCLAANAQTVDLYSESTVQTEAERAERHSESAYFSKTLALAIDLRPTRLISTDDFKRMSATEGTIILDTRSAESYAAAHLDGAINLPLTDMTELRLAETLPSRTMPILIYSDQNFGATPGIIRHDSSDLSLNLLSFLALSQYGYPNVYELGERVHHTDTRLSWESAASDALALPVSAISD